MNPSGNACNSLAPSGNWAWRTLRRKLAGKTRGLTGQNLSPCSVRVGGEDRVRTHCVSLLVPSEEAADCNHQHDAGEANRKLHRNVVADGGKQDLAEHREQDAEAEHLYRMLAAADDQSSNRSVQEPVVAPHEMPSGDSKR